MLPVSIQIEEKKSANKKTASWWGSKLMSHGSGRLDRRFSAASERITEHTLHKYMIFWVHNHVWNNWDRQASWLSFLTLGAVRSVTFLTAVTPQCDLPHSPMHTRLQSSTGVIQPCKVPSAAQGYLHAQTQTHTYAHMYIGYPTARTQTHLLHFNPTQPFLFKI